jgi:hypothetical protein
MQVFGASGPQGTAGRTFRRSPLCGCRSPRLRFGFVWRLEAGVGAGVIQVNGLGRRELRSQVPPYKGWQDDIGRREAEVPPGQAGPTCGSAKYKAGSRDDGGSLPE